MFYLAYRPRADTFSLGASLRGLRDEQRVDKLFRWSSSQVDASYSCYLGYYWREVRAAAD